ncbi:hypothetical protein BOX15_Mlig015870g3, partial [Macrostomum lignano]
HLRGAATQTGMLSRALLVLSLVFSSLLLLAGALQIAVSAIRYASNSSGGAVAPAAARSELGQRMLLAAAGCVGLLAASPLLSVCQSTKLWLSVAFSTVCLFVSALLAIRLSLRPVGFDLIGLSVTACLSVLLCCTNLASLIALEKSTASTQRQWRASRPPPARRQRLQQQQLRLTEICPGDCPHSDGVNHHVTPPPSYEAAVAAARPPSYDQSCSV